MKTISYLFSAHHPQQPFDLPDFNFLWSVLPLLQPSLQPSSQQLEQRVSSCIYYVIHKLMIAISVVDFLHCVWWIYSRTKISYLRQDVGLETELTHIWYFLLMLVGYLICCPYVAGLASADVEECDTIVSYVRRVIYKLAIAGLFRSQAHMIF